MFTLIFRKFMLYIAMQQMIADRKKTVLPTFEII